MHSWYPCGTHMKNGLDEKTPNPLILLAREEGFEPPTRWLTATCSTTELLPIKFGGADRNRTGVHGFAGRCVTTPPPRRINWPRQEFLTLLVLIRRPGN